MAEKKKVILYVVLHEFETVRYPTLRKAQLVKVITFTAMGLPPMWVEIPVEKYSPEVEKEYVRKRLEQELGRKITEELRRA